MKMQAMQTARVIDVTFEIARTYLCALILTGSSACLSLPGKAQHAFYSYSLFTLPPLAPDTTLAIPLGYSGQKKAHYSVLVRVRLPGDTLFHTIPGLLPTGDSFSFRLKDGYRRQCDTLYVTRRGGVIAVELAEILILTFNKDDRLLRARQDHGFTKAVLARYYDARTKRSAGVETTSEYPSGSISLRLLSVGFPLPRRARQIFPAM